MRLKEIEARLKLAKQEKKEAEKRWSQEGHWGSLWQAEKLEKEIATLEKREENFTYRFGR